MPELIAGLIAVVVFCCVYISWTAQRMDRMHVRLETARASLDAQLVRRAATARAIAVQAERQNRLPMPTGFLLQAAAQAALEADPAHRAQAENDLTLSLRSALAVLPLRDDDPDVRFLLHDLDVAARKVHFARTFYNDAVKETVIMRERRLVRLFRLAGRASLPEPFEIDDRVVVPGEVGAQAR